MVNGTCAMEVASTEPVISVRGLTKYFGEMCAVDHVDINVNKADVFGFLGPNGSGKTTTIRMLCGLLTPDAGTGQCLGHDILTESYQIKKHVGYMPQYFSLYKDLSVIENLLFVAQLYGDNPEQSTTGDGGFCTDYAKNQRITCQVVGNKN